MGVDCNLNLIKDVFVTFWLGGELSTRIHNAQGRHHLFCHRLLNGVSGSGNAGSLKGYKVKERPKAIRVVDIVPSPKPGD